MRLKKLVRVIKQHFNFSIDIFLSSKAFRGVAYTEFCDSYAQILVNGTIIKTEKQLLVAVAHELAHILLREPKHTKKHEEKTKEILKVLATEFGYKLDELLQIKKELDRLAGRG